MPDKPKDVDNNATSKPDTSDEVFKLKEAATFAKVTKELLARALRRGKLKGSKPSNSSGWHILKSRLIQWVDDGMPGTEPETEEERQQRLAEEAEENEHDEQR